MGLRKREKILHSWVRVDGFGYRNILIVWEVVWGIFGVIGDGWACFYEWVGVNGGVHSFLHILF